MSDDEIRKQVLKFLRSNSPASSREVRAGVTARAARVDEALRALLSEHRVDRMDDAWWALRRDGTRYGHDAGRVHPGGLQLPFRTTADVFAVWLLVPPKPARSWDEAQVRAEGMLSELLSEKQRARMHATNE
jgi:hypothetical protein